MKATARSWRFYLVGAGVLSSFTGLPAARAQAPQAAIDATLVPGDSESTAFQAPLTETRSPGSDDAAADEYLYRYAPTAGLWELGVFGGPLFISDRNSFRDLTFEGPTQLAAIRPFSVFKQPSVELGIRGGYYPFSFLGAELEGLIASAETRADDVATVLGGRGQFVVQAPYWSLVPFLVGGFGFWNVRNAASGNDVDPAFHFGGGAKLNISRVIALRADVRDSITNHRGNDRYPHNIEMLIGATLVLGRPDPRPPLVAEPCIIDAFPAPAATAQADSDGDGVADAEDPCPLDPGISPTGCPDSDGDGFIDRVDACVNVPGATPDGCLPDEDADGIARVRDACPELSETWNGYEDTDGCPDELPADVRKFVVAGVQFETDAAAISPGFEPMLAQIATILADYPSVNIEVVGHTDDRGTREHNIDLSQRRAEAVQADLIARGIESGRIQVRGEGPDSPLTSNDTPAGRQTNRRSEFRVVR